MPEMRAALVAVLAGLFVFPAAAGAWEPPTGWDGTNPFNCELQDAAFTATGPQPDADPYCVRFDKTQQNVTEGGLIDFLMLEPGRISHATGKCFYYQADHWRSSVVQSDGRTEIWEWEGRYFFDRARGEGGVYVRNFQINGRTEDPRRVPGIPEEFSQHMGPGTGGFRTRNASEVDPACVARANDPSQEPVYAPQEPAGSRVSAGGDRRPASLPRLLVVSR